jgi:hypothetical protein
MPLNNPAPNFGLLTSFDMTGQSGATVFTRSGGSDVDLPTFTGDQGYYEDVLFFLNGRGVDASFKADYQLHQPEAVILLDLVVLLLFQV